MVLWACAAGGAAQTRYELVADAEGIEAGTTYLIVGYTGGNYYALGGQSGSYRKGVKVTVQTDDAGSVGETGGNGGGAEVAYITIENEAVTPVRLVANGTYYNLQTTDGTFLCGEDGNSALRESASASGNTVLWEVLGVTSAGSTRLRNRSGYYLRFYASGATFRAPSSETSNVVRLFKATTPTALSVPTTEVTTGCVVYDLQGRRIGNPAKGGLYIIGGKKTLIK